MASAEQFQELIDQVKKLTENQSKLEAELQAERARAAAQPPAPAAAMPPGVGIDTRLLGKPSDFGGAEADWQTWSVVFEGYASAAVPGMGEAMTAAAQPGCRSRHRRLC